MDKKTENAMIEVLMEIKTEIKTGFSSVQKQLKDVNEKLDHQTDVINKGFEEMQAKFDESILESQKRFGFLEARLKKLEDAA